MRAVSQPIAIITVPLSATKQHGATVSSLTSISLSPPLLAFSIKLPSTLVEGFKSSQKGILHFMGGNGEELARSFARQPKKGISSDLDLFEELNRKSMGVLKCSLVSAIPLKDLGGDAEGEEGLGSELFIVKVDNIEINDQVVKEEGSLVYWDHQYHIVGGKEVL